MPFVLLANGVHVPAPYESKAVYRTARDTVDRYVLRRHHKETLDAFVELIVKVNEIINKPETYVGSEYITPPPAEVLERIKHFSNDAQKKMLVASWIDAYDNADFNLMVEKFYGTSEFDSNDDVWRVTANDYSVCFLVTRQTLGSDSAAYRLDVPWNLIEVKNDDHPWGLRPSRYIQSGTLFQVSGSLEGLHRDALMWKFSR